MKKIALCSLLMCLGILNSYGANFCKHSITFSPRNNNWNAGSNEYLFETKRDYMSVVNTGYFYECDSSYCPNGSYVSVASKHVFGGRTIHEEAYYKCSTSSLDDKWERVTDVSNLTKCDKLLHWDMDGLGRKFQNAEADEYLYPTVTDFDALKGRVSAQVYECDSSVCEDGTIIVLPAGHVFERKDIAKQRKYKCVLGTPGDDKWVDITDDCEDCNKKEKRDKVVPPTPQPQPKPNPNPQPEPDPQPDPEPVPVVEEDCYYILNVDIKCNNNTKEFKKGEQIKLTKEQVSKLGGCATAQMNAHNFESIIKSITQEYKESMELIELVCGSGATSISPVKVGPNSDELSKATATLEDFTNNASKQASVWKDAEGNFNTARLASDLTAGVVLGTVGGVVSGVVIKKKQIEKGFDALHCTVGGQKVADWGDTFTIGLRR